MGTLQHPAEVRRLQPPQLAAGDRQIYRLGQIPGDQVGVVAAILVIANTLQTQQMGTLFFAALAALQGGDLRGEACRVERVRGIVDLILLAIATLQQEVQELDQLLGGVQRIVTIDPLANGHRLTLALAMGQAPGRAVQRPHQRQRGKL